MVSRSQSKIPLTIFLIMFCISPGCMGNSQATPSLIAPTATATYYILSLAVILHNSLITGVLVFAIYGAARGFLLWPFSWQNRAPGTVERLTYYMDLTKPIMHQINGFVLVIANLNYPNGHWSGLVYLPFSPEL
jgi:hypothetical protein